MNNRDKLIEILEDEKRLNTFSWREGHFGRVADFIIKAFPQLEESEEVKLFPSKIKDLFWISLTKETYFGDLETIKMPFNSKQEAIDWTKRHNFKVKEE